MPRPRHPRSRSRLLRPIGDAAVRRSSRQQVAAAPAVDRTGDGRPSAAPSVTVVESEQMVEAERQLAHADRAGGAIATGSGTAVADDSRADAVQAEPADRRTRSEAGNAEAGREARPHAPGKIDEPTGGARRARTAARRAAARREGGPRPGSAAEGREARPDAGSLEGSAQPGSCKDRTRRKYSAAAGYDRGTPAGCAVAVGRPGGGSAAGRPAAGRAGCAGGRRSPAGHCRGSAAAGRGEAIQSLRGRQRRRLPDRTRSRASSSARLRRRFQATPRATSKRKSPRARRMRSRPRPPSRRASRIRRSARRSCSSASIRWARRSAASSRGRRVRSRNSMTARRNAEVKLAALPPADSATDVRAILQEMPSEQVVPPVPIRASSKDPNARGGETIAPKGEVTGADKRPMTPAERLGLARREEPRQVGEVPDRGDLLRIARRGRARPDGGRPGRAQPRLLGQVSQHGLRRRLSERPPPSRLPVHLRVRRHSPTG